MELEQVAKEFASKNMFRSDMWADQYFIAGAQWQSQHTAKEIEALQARVSQLDKRLQLRDLEIAFDKKYINRLLNQLNK